MIKLNDRVWTTIDSLGHVESIEPDGIMCDVRLLTPSNTPSACSFFCPVSSLVKVPASVVPMPASKAWWRKASALKAAIEEATSRD